MKKNQKSFFNVSFLKDPKMIAVTALFVAASIVCGKFLAFNLGETMRFSIENLPIILSGIFFGPIAGMLTGLVSDILGCILRGYAINPIITAAAVLIGFLSGVFWQLLSKLGDILRSLITVFICHITGSIIIKTVGLWVYFGSPFFATLGLRSLNYLIVGAAEFLIVYLLTKNKGFMKQIKKVS